MRHLQMTFSNPRTMRRWLAFTLAATLSPALLAQAQEAAELRWEDIRKGRLEAVDRRNLQAWLDAQLKPLFTTSDTTTVQEKAPALYRQLREQYTHSESTAEFRAGLAQLLSEAFVKHYQPAVPDAAEAPRPLAAAMILLTLRDFAHKAGLPAMRAGLQDPTAGPRTMAAEGLIAIRGELTDADWTALLADAQKAASKEPNPVALSRMYRLLATDNADRAEAATPIVMGILDNRFQRFEQQLKLPAPADAEAVVWLLSRAQQSTNATFRSAVALRAARLLADVVDVYLNDTLRPAQKEGIERSILDIEAPLATLVQAVNAQAVLPSPTVSAALTGAGTLEQKAGAIRTALNAWIGTADQPGVLNGAPFNLPAGLGIQRAPRGPTATATTPS